MCGIAGIYNLNQKPVLSESIKVMTDVIAHRGPDDEGIYIDGSVGLGHRRLSIIDLSPLGHQPMPNEDDSIWIVFNGEIYNYVELIPDLQEKGHKFRSHSDTEVIIHLYEEYGVDSLQYLNGMFSFAIWDKKNTRLFCARDRLGIKPFYYIIENGQFIFSSEIKAILKICSTHQPNFRAIYYYIDRRWVDFDDETFFDKIKRLYPASYILFEGSSYSIKEYWNPVLNVLQSKREDDYYIERFKEEMNRVIKIHLRSDVPVGTCLSGGVDSSTVVCLTSRMLNHPVKTFSVSYNESKDFDEREYINEVVKYTNSESYLIVPDGSDLIKTLDDIIYYQDEPIPSEGVYSQWQVMKLAGQQKMKVLLDGQGGDELLGGYLDYYYYYLWDLFFDFKFKDFIKDSNLVLKRDKSVKFIRNLFAVILGNRFRDVGKKIFGKKSTNILNKSITNKYQRESDIAVSPYKAKGFLNTRLVWDLTRRHLQSLLRFEDKNSMAFSIESRVPFLDYKLVEFVVNLPYNLKIRGAETKYILRRALSDVLPQKILQRRDKKGFETPTSIWLKSKCNDEVEKVIFSSNPSIKEFCNIDAIKEKWNQYLSGNTNLHQEILRVIMLELWLKKFF